MKRSGAAGLMLCSVLLFAQGVKSQEAPKVHSMTGCLKAGATPGSYMLTDLAKGPKTVGTCRLVHDIKPAIVIFRISARCYLLPHEFTGVRETDIACSGKGPSRWGWLGTMHDVAGI